MNTSMESQYAPNARQSAPGSVRTIGLVSTIVGCLFTLSIGRKLLAVVVMKPTAAISGAALTWSIASLSLKLALGIALLVVSTAFMRGRPRARRWVVMLSAALAAWIVVGIVQSLARYGTNVFSSVPTSVVQFKNIFAFSVPFIQALWPIGALAAAFRRDVRAFFDSQSTGQSAAYSAPGAGRDARAPHDRARAA